MLAMLGTEESDVVNWGRMRMLANYKMVKRLTEIKAKDVPFKVMPDVHIFSVGQNPIYTPYMTVYLVISLPKIPYAHRI